MGNGDMHSGHRERMRARFRTENGLDSFAEHEVLEMLLFNILPRVNTNETAHRLLGEFGNLREVLSADVGALCRVEGVGVKCAEQLAFLGHVFRRAEKESFLKVQADDFASLSAYLKNFFCGDSVERLCAFSISGAGRITACKVLSVGVSDRVTFDKTVLTDFLAVNSSATLLLSHNHPYGSAEPSEEDLMLTRKVINMLGGGVRLIDHVIVGADEVISLRRTGCFRAFE